MSNDSSDAQSFSKPPLKKTDKGSIKQMKFAKKKTVTKEGFSYSKTNITKSWFKVKYDFDKSDTERKRYHSSFPKEVRTT